MNLDAKTDLMLERVIDTPRQLVWECWTQPQHIKQFFV
ncbi:polyketide cyclase, partial [Enterobacter kobei]|nr:polyketide cyclase [Enterobacter kobei]